MQMKSKVDALQNSLFLSQVSSTSTRMETSFSTIIVLLLVSFSCFTCSETLTTNNGDISIKWDLISWTPFGYVAVVTAYNNQKQRSVPGWKMSWRWTRKEIIWSIIGAQATKQGDCSMFKGEVPHSCVRNPTIVDLLPSTPNNQQVSHCCKSGTLKPGSVSSFQLSVGNAGTSVNTARMPVNFLFTAPRQQYICGPTKNVRPTRFITADKRRMTSALMTWNVTCVFNKAA